MSLFDGTALTLAEINAKLGHSGETIRGLSQNAPGRTVWRTKRHRPWWELLGKGPEDKRCADCQFLVRKRASKTYLKCGKQNITSGPGTDIRAKDSACRLFEGG